MSSYGVKVGAGVVGARQHTLQPVVTGASVLGIKCADGVVLAADTLGE
jgi:20S proteasome alpha/beta subunit|eukprot:SAG25_NODE_343_length_9443_cov_3.590218_14_plen_48_part_00